jgi:GMP synthase-like glutamine amidotransferase
VSPTKARLLALLHTSAEPLGRLEQWLGDSVEIDVIVMKHAPVPATLDGYDGLIVMGGPQNACGPDHEPFAGERALIRSVIAEGKAYLGICLGAQVLAAALGGRVEPREPERGMHVVRTTAAAEHDELLKDLAAEFRVPQWHGDHITQLPSGAIQLASSDVCAHQAFRVGDRAWGLQFHPEVTPEIMSSWSRHDGYGDPQALAAEVEQWRAEEGVDELWGRAMARFVRLLG